MVKIDTKKAIGEFRLLALTLDKRNMHLACSSAINRSLEQGRTVARKVVSSQYNISQKNLAAISINRSTAATLHGEIAALGSPIALTAFSPKYNMPNKSIRISRRGKVTERKFKRSRSKGMGVSIEVYKGKREVLPYAFITPKINAVFARGKYTGRGFEQRTVRERKTGNDLPITSMLSISVHTSVMNPASRDAINRKVNEVFPRIMLHQVKYRISKLKNK